MEETPDKPPISSIAAPAATATTIPIVGSAETDMTTEEGFSILQKGLFFMTILGCVAFYIRMNNNKKGTKRYAEKSMA